MELRRLTTAQRALAEEHAGLVRAIARRVCRRFGGRIDVRDLEGLGFDGLMWAAARYQDGRGASFATFAGYRIRGAMLDGARALRAQAACESLEAAAAVLAAAPAADELLARREERRRLLRAVARLRGRERHFVRRVYVEGVDIAAAGAEVGISKSWASRLHARTVRSLRVAIADAA
jgi:RNA polymerase sigma factor for flagellar operon FliA